MQQQQPGSGGRAIALTVIVVVLLAAAGYGGYRYALYRVTNRQTKVHIMQPGGDNSSPIIVGNGSVHIRQHDSAISILPMDNIYHAYAILKAHAAVDIRIGRCTPNQAADSGHCTGYGPAVPAGSTPATPIPAPWTLQIYADTGGTTLSGTLSTPDANHPELILYSAAPSQTVGNENDDGQNGDGVVQGTPGNPGVGAFQLTAGGRQYGVVPCPAPAGGDTTSQCTVLIRYCTSKTKDSDCK